MPPNSSTLNQTCIFPHPLTRCTPGKERNTIRNCFVLLLNFKKILELLVKDITQYLLTYLAQCFTWSMWVYVCFLSSLLDSLFICKLLYMCLCVLSPVFASSIAQSRSWKRKDSGGILLDFTSRAPCTLSRRDAISPPRCHFQAYSSLPAEPH